MQRYTKLCNSPKTMATKTLTYLPCNFFSVSQNFCNSVKYLSRMKTFERPNVAIVYISIYGKLVMYRQYYAESFEIKPQELNLLEISQNNDYQIQIQNQNGFNFFSFNQKKKHKNKLFVGILFEFTFHTRITKTANDFPVM